MASLIKLGFLVTLKLLHCKNYVSNGSNRTIWSTLDKTCLAVITQEEPVNLAKALCGSVCH